MKSRLNLNSKQLYYISAVMMNYMNPKQQMVSVRLVRVLIFEESSSNTQKI